jgi:hypothetical protein
VTSERGRHRLRLLLPQPSRTLEVSEQERHRPRRQLDRWLPSRGMPTQWWVPLAC